MPSRLGLHVRSTGPRRRGAAELLCRPVLRIGVIGTSQSEICGVRSYANLLEKELESLGVASSQRWWMLPERARAGDLHSAGTRWIDAAADSLRDEGVDLILWHYSVFTLGYRGVPTLVLPFCRALRRTGRPIVTFLHEFAHPWGVHGARGWVWALTQRTVLPVVLALSRGVVVTTDARDRWLENRRLLPRRSRLRVPVMPVLTASAPERTRAESSRPDILMIGYSPAEIDVGLVLRAFAEVRAQRPEAVLVLAGAPGSNSAWGRVWQDAARAARCHAAVRFTEVLPAEELAAAIDSAPVVLFANREGASSRKTTLALALSRGKAVVALEGPQAWDELLQASAVRVVPAVPGAIAAELVRLLDDPQERARQQTRAADFHASHQSPARLVPRFVEFFERVLEARPGGAASRLGAPSRTVV